MNVSGRRQRQARNGYRHLAKHQRPLYRVRDAATSARRLRDRIQRERDMAMRKGRKGMKAS